MIHLVCPGHGGINPRDGSYFTNPKWDKKDPKTWHKMHYHEQQDFVVYEGVINRHIVENIMIHGNLAGLKVVNIVPEQEDISLNERINRINQWHSYAKSMGEDCVFWEHHNNWWDKESVKGYEVYSTTRKNFSDTMSQIWLKEMEQEFPDHVKRGGKETNFTVIQNTTCYAVLIEWAFMSNWEEVERLFNTEGYKKMANVMINAMKETEKAWPK